MKILGIDPGWHITGYGILHKVERSVVLVDYGYLSMSTAKTLVERSGTFHDFFAEKIRVHGVTDLALETPFLGKNAQNFLKLGYLRGILYLLASRHGLILHEYSPREVKTAVTGFGGAEKEQVARVIVRLFPALQQPDKLDVTDALAVTLCGLWKAKHPLGVYKV